MMIGDILGWWEQLRFVPNIDATRRGSANLLDIIWFEGRRDAYDNGVRSGFAHYTFRHTRRGFISSGRLYAGANGNAPLPFPPA